MRVSEYYGLARRQPDLDFVDVDVAGDVRVFLDPRALRFIPTGWGTWSVSLLQNFFHTVLEAIRAGKHDEARRLLARLNEPNETHLGYSRGRARGRALGPASAKDVWEALSKSEAVKSGLLEDLEDTILMVERINSDIVSDIATNVIREPLIAYTQEACQTYGIPVASEVSSGPLWDPENQTWRDSQFVQLPVAEDRRLLLVPKAIVRLKMDYSESEYYRHYLLEHLREVEISANTELVRLLKDGRKHAYKKDLTDKYGEGKGAIVRLTRQYPNVLDQYRRDKGRRLQPPLDHVTLSEALGVESPDWDELVRTLRSIPTGTRHAGTYHRAVEAFVTPLFYPSLVRPQLEYPIHGGRKRIDITYTNLGVQRFFAWLSANYHAPLVFVECKNYDSDPANPELDQLAGRFSPLRGQFGLLVCRGFKNKQLFMERCRDTARDHRGFIVPLDDDDLAELAVTSPERRENRQYDLLMERFQFLLI